MMVRVKNEDELFQAVTYAKEHGLAPHFLGEGTNTFFGNNLDLYLVIKIEILGKSVEKIKDKVILRVGAGELFDDVVMFSVENNWWRLENLSFIPGTMGAAPVQNIGAYGTELKDVCVQVRAYDCEKEAFVLFSKEMCEFTYRDSLFKKNGGRFCITEVTLELSLFPSPVLEYKPLDSLVGRDSLSIQEVRGLVVATRSAKLPNYKEHSNAGSFFKNPVVDKETGGRLRERYPDMPLIVSDSGYKIPAAWFIEHIAHKKGVRMGNVGTWPNQPLVIVNYGQSTAEELLSFSGSIIDEIQKETGVELKREVNYVK